MAKKFILLAVLFIVSAIAESTTDTTATPGTSVSVATEAPGTISTEAPDTNSTDAPSTAPVSTATQVPPTESSNPCDPNPCFDGSTCEAHFNMTYVCLCPPGEIYNSVTCQKVKVFPGQLMLDITYDPKMEDKRSAEFLNASLEIISAVRKLLSLLVFSIWLC
ncbi:mucin-13-like [Kryptolebias marmoratus]|uniref:mucin-13-like n=1 Tax=Kryptolebias marmoratus TaxID=37003 RepID=UPI0007F885B8|nr:mucin-13-like [Kryptolebias marmoratus]